MKETKTGSPGIREALIAQAASEPGALGLLRLYQQAREADPGLATEEIIGQICNPALAEEGAAQEQRLRERFVKVLTLLDSDYPNALRHIADPPLVLFYCGELQTLHRPAIAIVGSRKCTTYGRSVAMKLSAELAHLGFVLVSGLAKGIDTAVHQACVEVKGRTIAVLGSGPDQIYPPENRPLAKRLVHEAGVVVSEFPPGTPIRPFHFPIRNRIISGLCHATIVVEAQEKSGSLITARHCLEQGRELFAVPGPINRSECYGSNQMIGRGEARMLLSIEDVLTELKPLLGLAAAHDQRVQTEITDPESKRIYERLDAFEPLTLDELAADLSLTTGLLTAQLMELESRRLVERLPGPRFIRNPLL